MEKRMKPVIIDKNASNLLDVVEACPVGCFVNKGSLVFVARPHECIGCGVCESITKGVIIENKQ